MVLPIPKRRVVDIHSQTYGNCAQLKAFQFDTSMSWPIFQVLANFDLHFMNVHRGRPLLMTSNAERARNDSLVFGN